ncbi:MAG TPA: tetratricopeptide repeat protein, partial [Kofleriaceae bacterium]
GIERQLAEITTIVGKGCARLAWHRGTIERVDFDLTTGSRAVLAELLARPELAFVREVELRIGWPIETPKSDAVLAELPAMLGGLPLRFLGIGTGRTTIAPPQIDALWAALPRLAGLGVYSERTDDALEAIRNHRPSIVDLGAPDLNGERLRRLLGELWPGITSLVVYAGQLERTDLEPLVEPGAFPGLVRLGVMGGTDRQNDTFVDLLAERGMLERLSAIGFTVHRADASNQRLLRHKHTVRTTELFTAPSYAMRNRAAWAEAWHDLGHLFDELGRHERALAEFEALATFVPKDARFLQDIGEQLAHLRRNDEALVALDAALALDPDQERALHSRALALTELDRLDDAIAAWDLAQTGREAEAYLWDDRAETLARVGRIDEAIAACDRSLALVRGDLDTLAMRARLLAHAERFEDAIDAFTKLARRKAASDVDKARAHMRLAQVSIRLGKPALARRQLERAASGEIADKWIAETHAAFLLEQGDPAAAAVWRGVTGADEAHGFTLLELGRPVDALPLFERAGAMVGQALALHALGRDDEARVLLERAWTEQTCPYELATVALAGAAVAHARGKPEGRERWLHAIRSDETGCRASHELLLRGAAAIRTTPDDDHTCRPLAACRARTTVALTAAALADGAGAEATQRMQALAGALEHWDSASSRLHAVRLAARELLNDGDRAMLARAVELAEGLVPRVKRERPTANRPARPKRPV